MKIVIKELIKPIIDFKTNKFKILVTIMLSIIVTLLNVYSPVLVKNMIDLGIDQKNIDKIYIYIFY